MQDIMVDVETTGLEPDNAGILQIGAVRFNAQTGEVGDTFDRCLRLPPKRYWDESTRNWWMRQPKVLESILARQEDPFTVLRDFQAWACKHGPSPIMWAKPIVFDHAILQSYFRQFDLLFPFHFRVAQDMNSFLRGKYWPEPVPANDIQMTGDAHNGLDDCFYQLEVLFHHVHNS